MEWITVVVVIGFIVQLWYTHKLLRTPVRCDRCGGERCPHCGMTTPQVIIKRLLILRAKRKR